MGLLKTYTISTDISAGAVNSEKLTNELFLSGDIQGYDGINIHGEFLDVYGDVFNEIDVDALILNHIPKTLEEAKIEKNEEINDKTGDLISAGYAHSGMQFSLSIEAQVNIIGLLLAKDGLTYPVDFNNLDDTDQHQIVDANEIVLIFNTALVTKKTILDSGTALKQQVEAATNQYELDAIVDNR